MSVGIDHGTATFAVNAIRRCWTVMGHVAYPTATSLLIPADAGAEATTLVRLRRW